MVVSCVHARPLPLRLIADRGARFIRWTSGSLLVAGGLWLALRGE